MYIHIIWLISNEEYVASMKKYRVYSRIHEELRLGKSTGISMGICDGMHFTHYNQVSWIGLNHVGG